MTRKRYLEQALKIKTMNDSLPPLEAPRPARRFSAFIWSQTCDEISKAILTGGRSVSKKYLNPIFMSVLLRTIK